MSEVLFRVALLLSHVATCPLVRTSSYPTHQVGGLQELVGASWASSVGSLWGRRKQNRLVMVEKTSWFVASAPAAIIAVVAVAVAAAAVARSTAFDVAVPGGGLEDGRLRLRRSRSRIATAKT